MLVEAVKAQQQQKAALQARVAALEESLHKTLEARLTAFEEALRPR